MFNANGLCVANVLLVIGAVGGNSPHSSIHGTLINEMMHFDAGFSTIREKFALYRHPMCRHEVVQAWHNKSSTSIRPGGLGCTLMMVGGPAPWLGH